MRKKDNQAVQNKNKAIQILARGLEKNRNSVEIWRVRYHRRWSLKTCSCIWNCTEDEAR